MIRTILETNGLSIADDASKIHHFLELTPKRVNRTTPIRMVPTEMGKRLGAIIENETVYEITTQIFQDQHYSMISTGKIIGWVNSMWLEDL